MQASQTLGKRTQADLNDNEFEINQGADKQNGVQRKRDSKERESTRLDSSTSGHASKPKVAIDPEGVFSQFPEITDQTKRNLADKGITGLFPIQYNCFRPIYERHDLIGRDLTGSGKTLAFALPIVEQLRRDRLLGSRQVQAIVLAPTRELALQCANTFNYLKHSPNEFDCLTVYGGVPIDPQINSLRRGVEIFVGTTGRVLDHIERGNIDFSQIRTIVLDEADQMLKLGFKEDIERILGSIRKVQKSLQICLFSATVPTWVHDVAREHMKPGLKHVDLCQDLRNKTAKKVKHLIVSCSFQRRISALADILTCYGGTGRSIVFTQTKADANSLLLTDKIKQDVEVMHGDIAQNQREITLKRFREGKFRCLVATDVASRGLDIPSVELVIQVEPPKEVETYIHRSGRTARAGASGTCITFYDNKNRYMIDEIERHAGIKFEQIPVPSYDDVMKHTAKDMLSGLNVVSDDVLPMFEEAAKELLNQQKGNAISALSKTLAFISGHHQKSSKQKSDGGSQYGDRDYDNDYDGHGGGNGRSGFGSSQGRGGRGRGDRGGGGRGGSSNYNRGDGGNYRNHKSSYPMDDGQSQRQDQIWGRTTNYNGSGNPPMQRSSGRGSRPAADMSNSENTSMFSTPMSSKHHYQQQSSNYPPKPQYYNQEFSANNIQNKYHNSGPSYDSRGSYPQQRRFNDSFQ